MGQKCASPVSKPGVTYVGIITATMPSRVTASSISATARWGSCGAITATPFRRSGACWQKACSQRLYAVASAAAQSGSRISPIVSALLG